MAWVTLKLNVHGETQVARAFEASARQAEDMREPLGDVGESIIQTVGEQFQSEGAHGGLPWKPLNREYAAWKEAQVGPNPILVFSGAMRRTVLDRLTSLTITPKRLIYKPVGEHADIAAFHQEGHVAGEHHGPLPQRRIVQIPSTVSRSWERYFHEWLRTDVLWRFQG